jgi:DNA-binding transcriptional regulator YhcF (GntR family)
MPGSDFLQLDPAAAPAHGLADWLTAALRAGVADGRLSVGTRLPATRGLALQLGVSRGVVVQAYQRLTDEGLLAGQRGGGTTVVTAALPAPEPSAERRRTDVEINLSPGLPDLSAFPRQAWLRAERAALGALAAADLGYGDPRGTPALRAALAGWLTRTRGVRTTPDDIIVVNGVAQGLALLVQVLRARGASTIGFEDPGSRGTRAQLRQWAVEPLPVPVDDTVSTCARWPRPAAGPWSSPRRTSSPPAWCWLLTAAASWPHGPAPAAWSSRTTTTPSTVTTGLRWPRCRRWPRRPWCTSAACPRRSRRRCGWAGCWPRPRCATSWSSASAGRTSPARRWASWPWPR